MQLLTISPSRKELEEDRQRAPLLTGDALRSARLTIAGHSQRTALLAQTLARGLKRPEEEAHLIARAALMHDIGKLSIPATTLNKPGPLTEQEWTIMRSHPQIGYLMLIGAGGIYSRIAPLVLAHHERWDGLGYPLGLAGEAIPLGARILAVVDAYDAIIEWRPYRPSRSTEEAKAEVLRCAGSFFDPMVVEVLLQVVAGKHSVIRQHSPIT
jgi:HD-GYP domain-containing protein (c-di-GMP phosphodiesterase class II)